MANDIDEIIEKAQRESLNTEGIDDIISDAKKTQEKSSQLVRNLEIALGGVVQSALTLPTLLENIPDQFDVPIRTPPTFEHKLFDFPVRPSFGPVPLSAARAVGTALPNLVSGAISGKTEGPVPERFGLPSPERGNVIENISQEVGAALIPGGTVMKAGSKAAQLPRFIKSLVESAAKRPGAFIAGEATAAAGAGTGRAAAQSIDASPAMELAFEISGGLVGGGVATASNAFTRAGRREIGEVQAATFIQQEAGDVDAESLRNLPEGLTPAEFLEDPGLARLQRGAIGAGDGGTKQKEIDLRKALSARATAEIEEISGGNPEAAIEFSRDRIEQIRDAIVKEQDLAIEEVRLIDASISRTSDTSDLSRRMIDLQDAALANSRTLERAAWDNVDLSVQGNTAPLKAFLQGRGRTATERADVPKLSKSRREVIENWGEFTPMREIQAFRSSVLEDIRDIQSRGNVKRRRLKLSQLQDLQETALSIMIARDDSISREAARGATTAQSIITGIQAADRATFSQTQALKYRTALEATRQLNQTFYTGDVGKLLGYATRTAADEDVALKNLLSGARGPANIRQLVDSMGPEEVAQLGDEFVDRIFALGATDSDGHLVPRLGKNFIKRNEALLNEFPETRDRITQMTDLASSSQEKIKLSAQRLQSEVERSQLGMVSGLDHSKVAGKILGSGNPQKAAADFRASIQDSPEALEGFRRIWVEDLLRSSTQSVSDPTARSVGKYVNTNRRTLLAAGITEEELGRLKTLENELRQSRFLDLQAGRGSTTVPNLSAMMAFAGRAVGSMGVRALGLNTIQATSGGATLGLKLAGAISENGARAIIEDAIFAAGPDADLMRTLLLKPTPANTPIIINRLRGHFGNLGVDIDKILEEEEAPVSARQRETGSFRGNF